MLKLYCKANRCAAEIRSGRPSPVLMCRKHWMMVPESIRDRMYDCAKDHASIEDATTEYLLVAADAIEAVARLEGTPTANAFRRLAESRTAAGGVR